MSHIHDLHSRFYIAGHCSSKYPVSLAAHLSLCFRLRERWALLGVIITCLICFDYVYQMPYILNIYRIFENHYPKGGTIWKHQRRKDQVLKVLQYTIHKSTDCFFIHSWWLLQGNAPKQTFLNALELHRFCTCKSSASLQIAWFSTVQRRGTVEIIWKPWWHGIALQEQVTINSWETFFFPPCHIDLKCHLHQISPHLLQGNQFTDTAHYVKLNWFYVEFKYKQFVTPIIFSKPEWLPH